MIGLMSTQMTVSVSCHDTHRSSYVTLLHQLIALGYSGQTAVKQDAVVKAFLCVKVQHQSVWKELLQPYCLPIKCNRTSNSGSQMKTIILVVSASAVASVGCHCVPPCLHSGSVRRGLTPHVEHHSHCTVVSHGAGESLSSAPTGIKPGVENWDLTVKAMTSCFAHLLLLLLLIDSVFNDSIGSISLSLTCIDKASFWPHAR